ncbi:MAG: heme exporter protein CcmD [Methyloceanibacter sp.]
MLDLGPHASFIIAAYGVTAVAVGALAFFTIEDDRTQRRTLAELERKGIKRRSAKKPRPAKRKPRTTSKTKPRS